MLELMHHAEHERIRLEAARLILEYGGHKAAAHHEVRLSIDQGQMHARTVQAAWAARLARRSAGGNPVDSATEAASFVSGPEAITLPYDVESEDLGKTEE